MSNLYLIATRKTHFETARSFITAMQCNIWRIIHGRGYRWNFSFRVQLDDILLVCCAHSSDRYQVEHRVFNLVSVRWEEKFHIYKQPCTFCLLHKQMTMKWRCFRPISEDFRRYCKIIPKARRPFPYISLTYRNIIWRLQMTTEEDQKTFRS